MIINSFTASNVHGVYNFDFQFNMDINFLVGINGSGKTSALRLMEASLSLDIAALLAIRFDRLEINVDSGGQKFILKIFLAADRMIFQLNDTEFFFDNMGLIRDELISRRASSTMVEFIENKRIDILKSGGRSLQNFISGTRPLFLGLERKIGRYEDNIPSWEAFRPSHMRPASRSPRESLEGLDSCQRLIERAYTQYRRASDGRVDRLSNIILESTFEYVEFDPTLLNDPSRNPFYEISQLNLRREEIEKYVRDLGGSEKAVGQIRGFFEKMSQVVGNSKTSKDPWSFEWFLNMAQIKRIRDILSEMDRQKRSAEKYYAPIREFSGTINKFFAHSRKELVIDAVGKIKITQGGNTVDLDMLSSGEKQLLILLAHARFGSTKRNSFIVDEPELSLHMRWQEMLVDSLLEIDKSNQFIFATHSPEIVGYLKEKCIRVG